jgi:hypothetical protein
MNNSGATNVIAANIATINQQSGRNSATNIVFGGGGGAGNATSNNTSTITQRGGAAGTVGTTAVTNGNNTAFVSVSQGSQMSSVVDQNGSNNFVDVTLASGVAGNNTASADVIAAGRTNLGNSSSVTQTGSGSTAYVVLQAPVVNGQRVQGQGIGNSATITQTATVAYQAPTGTSQPAGTTGTGEPANLNGSRGQYATVYQQGQFGLVSVQQTDNANGSGTAYTASNGQTIYGRPRAQLFQTGRLMSLTVQQQGDNYGEVTQGRLGQNVSSSIFLGQVDAGDTAGTPTGQFDPQGNPILGPSGRQYNRAVLVQYGDLNSLTAQQNTRNGLASLFQTEGTRSNSLNVQQGTGATLAFASGNTASDTIRADQGTGAATSNLSATVTQGGANGTDANGNPTGSNNGARVFQDGTNLTATVSQLGTGTGTVTFANPQSQVPTAANSGNIVQILQQGSSNSATARQTANVGQSGTPNSTTPCGTNNVNCPASGPAGGGSSTTAGTQRSAEIRILQGGSGHTAYAEQRGKGQFARIEQRGTGNTAGILQDTDATNATAMITQTGSGNTYYIVQTQPGQFIQVTQTGTGNTANTAATTSGPNDGGVGQQAAPAGFPIF